MENETTDQVDPIDTAFAEAGLTDEVLSEAPPEPQEAVVEQPAEEPAEGRARDEQGRFKAKEEEPVEQAKAEEPPKEEQPDDKAPERFVQEARDEWAKAAPILKTEVKRAFDEMEAGIAQYQRDFGDAKPFADWARENGTTVAKLINEYAGFEELLRNDPVRGFQTVAERLGFNLQDIAAKAAQPAEQNTQMQAMQQELQQLRAQVQGVPQQMQRAISGDQQQQAVTSFLASKPDGEAVRDDMGKLWTAGVINTQQPLEAALQEAYDKAQRLRAAAQSNPAPQPVQQPEAPQKPLGLGLSGAPAGGSNPASRRPPDNFDEHMDDIFQAVGLS